MSRFSLGSNVPRAPGMLRRKPLVSAALFLCAVSSVCIAQEKGQISPLPLLRPGQVPNQLVIQPKAEKNVIVGTWGITRKGEDKEVAEVETTIIVFNPDGSYTTRLRNSNFPEWEKFPMAGGRYAVTAADKAGFTLALERTSGDPEEDKATARSVIAVAIIDEKNLRAPDGAVLTRLK